MACGPAKRKKCSRQRRLPAAQDHCPLRTEVLPAADGSGELKQSREYGPNAEYAKYPVQSQCGDYSNCCGETDDDVHRLGTIVSHSSATRSVDVIGQRGLLAGRASMRRNLIKSLHSCAAIKGVATIPILALAMVMAGYSVETGTSALRGR